MPWIRCGSALLALAACGIPDGKALIELDAEELGELCEEFVAREVTCTSEDGEQTWTFGGPCEGASIAPTCTATAGDYRDCGVAVADTLAEANILKPVVTSLGKRATLHLVEHADHSFHVPVRTGRKDAAVLDEILDVARDWMLKHAQA
jgi:hypothetical protein